MAVFKWFGKYFERGLIFFEKHFLLAAYDQLLATYTKKLGTHYSFALGTRLCVPLWGIFEPF